MTTHKRGQYGRLPKQKDKFVKVETYYDQPTLHASHWGWEIVAYFFVGGLAGATQILATLLDLFGSERDQKGVRSGRYIALLGALSSPVLLIMDLKIPLRFINMLRIFRPTSAMSIGTYILSGFGLFTGITGVCQMLYDWSGIALFRRVARLSSLPASITGVGMSIYTGTLLAQTSVPLWSVIPRRIAALFGASAVTTASAAMSLASSGSTRRKLDRVGLVAGTTELLLSKQIESIWQEQDVEGPVAESPYREINEIGITGIGLVLPLVLRLLNFGGKFTPLSVLASLATLVGGVLLRYLFVYAGNESARRGRDYLELTHEEQTHDA